MASKIIFIRRKLSFAQMSHTDPEVSDWFNQAFKCISPYWNKLGATVGTGLTVGEQRLLMPYLHGVESDDRDFRKKTEEYFHNLLTKLPAGGLKLEIGLEKDDEPLSKDNFPLDIAQFVIYRHAIGHPKMALSEEEADRDPTKMYYIDDPSATKVGNIRLNELEDKALHCYFKYKDDEIKVDQILTLSGVHTNKLSPNEKIIKFKSLCVKPENVSIGVQQSTLESFIRLCEDPNLAVKYLIEEMIGAQVLERQGQTIFEKETGKPLGATLQEAVAFLQNPKNSKILNVLKGQYELVVKKGKVIDLSPTDIPADVDALPATGRTKEKPVVD